jgi:Domain of unknown function (DUF4145)
MDMSNDKLTQPEFEKQVFHCPLCGVYAHQNWQFLNWNDKYNGSGVSNTQSSRTPFLYSCHCVHCDKFSIWFNSKMLYPSNNSVEQPNDDMSEDIKYDYREAANIVNQSPRGAAALLRLAIQKLMIQLGENGRDINKDIGNLVKNGLPVQIQQALDTVRVVGNESVHPGELNLKDDIETVYKLFILINIIADRLITQPKNILDIFGSLPKNKLDGIENRDKNSGVSNEVES